MDRAEVIKSRCVKIRSSCLSVAIVLAFSSKFLIKLSSTPYMTVSSIMSQNELSVSKQQMRIRVIKLAIRTRRKNMRTLYFRASLFYLKVNDIFWWVFSVLVTG